MGCGASTEQPQYDHSLYKDARDWEELREDRITVSTGRELFFRRWTPKEASPRAHVFAMHGLHEHGGRFAGFAHELTKAGFAVFAADHFGQGQSGGTPGVLQDPLWLYLDQVAFIDAMLKDLDPQVPIFVHAHSLGSLIAIHVTHILTTRAENPIAVRTLGMTGPATDPGPGAASPFGMQSLFWVSQLGACTRATACCLSTVAPRAPFAPIWEHALTSDEEELALYRRDPWIYRGDIMNVTGYTSLRLVETAKALVPHLKLPVFVMHGAEDQITLPSGSQFVYNNLAEGVEKKIEVIPGSRHEIFHESPEVRTRAMEMMKEWYEAHL